MAATGVEKKLLDRLMLDKLLDGGLGKTTPRDANRESESSHTMERPVCLGGSLIDCRDYSFSSGAEHSSLHALPPQVTVATFLGWYPIAEL